jgi:hypothetical protein
MRGLVRMNSEDSARRLIGKQPSGSVPEGYVKKLDTAVARVAQRLSWLLHEPSSSLYEL